LPLHGFPKPISKLIPLIVPIEVCFSSWNPPELDQLDPIPRGIELFALVEVQFPETANPHQDTGQIVLPCVCREAANQPHAGLKVGISYYKKDFADNRKLCRPAAKSHSKKWQSSRKIDRTLIIGIGDWDTYWICIRMDFSQVSDLKYERLIYRNRPERGAQFIDGTYRENENNEVRGVGFRGACQIPGSQFNIGGGYVTDPIFIDPYPHKHPSDEYLAFLQEIEKTG